MDNQHQKISGYRDLNQEEIDLMNRLKEKEAECLALHKEVMRRLSSQENGSQVDQARIRDSLAHRWASIGRTDIETGFMALVRAVAQPQPKD